MAGQISAASAVSNAATTLGNLILVTPQNTIGYQPQAVTTINGQPQPQGPSILFHYEGENTATIESDITDHFIEDNTPIQDQIALKPVMVTTQGFVGELNNIPPNSVFQTAFQIAQKLTTISGYLPGLSVTALNAYNEAAFAYQTLTNLANNAVSTWSSITGSGGESVINGFSITGQPNQTKQQQYFQQFYGYWTNRTLFTVQTPWAIFENMAVKTLRAIQSADTNVVSDFEVTFKQLRFASTTLTTTFSTYSFANFQSRLQNQGAPLNNLGTSVLTPSTTSYSSLLSGF